MKQNKLVIGVLVLIAVLFVLGLSSGVFRDKNANDDELSIEKAQALKDRWIGSLEDVMARFRDPFDLDRLNEPAPPDCKIEDGVYKLTKENDNCTVKIEAKKDADIQEALITIKEDNAKLMVLYPEKIDGAADARGPRISIGKLKHSKTLADLVKTRPQLGQKPHSPKPLKVKAVYVPDGGEEQTGKWEETTEIKLMVLEKGGTISLKRECDNCGNDQPVTVVLK